MKKMIGYFTAAVVSVVLIAGMAGSIVLGVKMSDKLDDMGKKNHELQEKVEELLKKGQDVAQEDDVIIGEQYTIKSTKHISDAYLSGDDSKLNDKDKETLKMASDVIDKIIKDGMSDYEKELAVYEWLTMYTSQDEGQLVALPTTGGDSDNPYGVLKNKKAVCVGYATTFRMFMQMLNIECMVVHDSGLGHSWDLVKLDNEWYHTDIYMDAENANYNNFNMNDAVCSEGHDWNQSFFPAATGVKYSYAYQNKEDLNDVYKVPAKLKQAIQNKDKVVCFSLGKKTDDSDMKYSILENIINKISERVQMNQEFGNLYMEHHWNVVGDEQEYIVSVHITRYDKDTDNSNLTDKQLQKINQALTKAFGEYDWDYMGGDY